MNLRTDQVLEVIISLVSTGVGGGRGLGLLRVCSEAWESCLIDVADLFVVGFCNIFFCLLLSLNKVFLNSDLGNGEVVFILVLMKWF